MNTPNVESRYEYPEEKDWKQISVERLGFNPDACPVCKQLTMIMIFYFRQARGPEMIKDLIQKHQSKQASKDLRLASALGKAQK